MTLYYAVIITKPLILADIIFEVKDKPHQLFKREGTDLVYDSTIPLLIVRFRDENIISSDGYIIII